MANSRINPFYISQSEYDNIEDGEADDAWEDDDDDDHGYAAVGVGRAGGGVEQEHQRLVSSHSSSLGIDNNNHRPHDRNIGSYSSSVRNYHHQQQQQQYHNENHNHGGGGGSSAGFHRGDSRQGPSSGSPVKVFHRQGSPYDYRQSRDGQSPTWKVSIVVGFVIVLVVIAASSGGTGRSTDGGGGDKNYESLIDYAPNDELRLVVLGERHSGVSWMKARLHECFPHADISTELQREGFLFQDETDMKYTKRINQKDPIVVLTTLNVYDWLEHMRVAPEYAPNHTTRHTEYGHMVPLDFESFMSRPWTMDRPDRDLPLSNNTKGRICQQRFRYDQIVSCAVDEELTTGTDNPMYELQQDGDDGTPFSSILEFRAAKLQNHYNVQNWKSVKKFNLVPYEYAGQLFKDLVHDIQQFTEWKLKCTGDVLPPSKDRTASMTRSFIDYVTKNADWETEKLIVDTYKPWTNSDIDLKQIVDDDNTKNGDKNDDGEENVSETAADRVDINTTAVKEQGGSPVKSTTTNHITDKSDEHISDTALDLIDNNTTAKVNDKNGSLVESNTTKPKKEASNDNV